MVSTRIVIFAILVVGAVPLVLLGSYLVSHGIVGYGITSAIGGILLFIVSALIWWKYGLDYELS